jgi:transcriptional regulator with XRE-family HTH domain
MKNEVLGRLLEALGLVGVEKGARNKLVAEKTGYSVKTIGNILSGHSDMTPRFIQAVCSAFGIDREWVERGDNIAEWPERIAAKFCMETGELASPEDIEAGRVNHQRADFARLLRIHYVLSSIGIPKQGRVAAISTATKISQAQAAGMLAGYFPLTDNFLRMLCIVYKLDLEHIELGDDRPTTVGMFRPMLAAMRDENEALRKQQHERLDAPTQEVVNDMKKLTESNRWVFVGRVKPIIQEMLEEQGEGKPEKP